MNSYGKWMLAKKIAEVRRILHHEGKNPIISPWYDKNVIEKEDQGVQRSERTRKPSQKSNNFL